MLPTPAIVESERSMSQPLVLEANSNGRIFFSNSDTGEIHSSIGDISLERPSFTEAISGPINARPSKQQISMNRLYSTVSRIWTGETPLYKVVVLGDADVGKLALTMQLTSQHLFECNNSTIEDSYRKQTVTDGHSCIVEILDTASIEGYTAIRDLWLKQGEGFVLVCSVTNRRSFMRISKFHDQIKRVKGFAAYPDYLNALEYNLTNLPPIMLVGNNSEREDRQVSTQKGSALAKELGCHFVEDSMKNRK